MSNMIHQEIIEGAFEVVGGGALLYKKRFRGGYRLLADQSDSSRVHGEKDGALVQGDQKMMLLYKEMTKTASEFGLS